MNKTLIPNRSVLGRLRPGLAGLACLFIGVFIAVHGKLSPLVGVVVVGFFVLAGGALARWLAGSAQQPWRELAEMGSIGTAAMLVGWWADIGFGPIIREGICWCSCVDIHSGWGLPDVATWMYGGMAAASVTMLPSRWEAPEIGRFATMLLGMFAGMFVSEWCLARVAPSDAQLHFFLTIASNAAAMLLGMWVACVSWERLTLRKETAAPTPEVPCD